jgi:hypothetical protein
MDKFPLLCTLAVVFVFFAGACGVAGVQNMKAKEDSVYEVSDGAPVRSTSSLTSRGFSAVTAEQSSEERLEKLLSPQRFQTIDSIMNGEAIEGINAESFNSIESLQKERRVTMERKAIEVGGELLISF